MPNIPLKLLDYPENIDLLNPETDGIRKMIDVINSNFLQLMYLVSGHITTANVNTDDLVIDPSAIIATVLAAVLAALEAEGTYLEHTSADWNPDGVEFVLENAYTDYPDAIAGISIDEGGTGTELAGAEMELPCIMVKETFDVEGVPTSCYSKIQVLPKGLVPVTIDYGKITLSAVCTGMVNKT